MNQTGDDELGWGLRRVVERASRMVEELRDDLEQDMPADIEDDVRALLVTIVYALHDRSSFDGLHLQALRRAAAASRWHDSDGSWIDLEVAARWMLKVYGPIAVRDGASRDFLLDFVASTLRNVRLEDGTPLSAEPSKVVALLVDAVERRWGPRKLGAEIAKLSGIHVSPAVFKAAKARERRRL